MEDGKITITITITISVPKNANVSISSSASPKSSGQEEKKQRTEKYERKTKMPKIRDVDDLLKFTKGDKEYAKAIIRKYNLHGISHGDKLYVVAPEFLRELEQGKTDMKELEEAIRNGEAIVVKPENLVKLL